MVALLLLLTSALPALQTKKKAVTRRNNLVPHISLKNSQGKVPGGASCSPFCFDARECDCSTQFQGRKQTDENNPLFPPSFSLYCQSPFHSLSFHSSLSHSNICWLYQHIFFWKLARSGYHDDIYSSVFSILVFCSL